MDSTERPRAAHPSAAQLNYLVNFLEKNPSLAKGFPKVTSAKEMARKTWARIAMQLNSLGGSEKTWKQWTKYWADKKSAVKKKNALRYKARSRAGGGNQVVELSEIEERILTVMGVKRFATGDMHLKRSPRFEEQSSMSSYGEDLKDENVPVTEGSLYPLLVFQSPSPPPTVGDISSPPSTPSVSGSHPQNQSRDVRQSIGSPVSNTTTSRPRHSHRTRGSSSSQRRSRLKNISQRILEIEEQKLEINRRNSELLERFVNQTMEKIGEGFKLLEQALKK